MWRVKQQTPTELLTLQICSKYFLNYCWQISDEALISTQSIGCCESSISQAVIGQALWVWLRGLHSRTHCRKATLGKPPTEPEPLPRGGPAWDVRLRFLLLHSLHLETSENHLSFHSWDSSKKKLLLFCHCSVERKGWCCEGKWLLHSWGVQLVVGKTNKVRS